MNKYSHEKKYINITDRKILYNNTKHSIFINLKKNKKFRFSKKRKTKIKYKNIYLFFFIIVIFTFVSIVLFINFGHKIGIKKIKVWNKKQKEKNIYYEYKFPSLHEAFNKGKNFLEICVKGLLLNNKTFIPSKKPKISAIITLYNSHRTISRAIKSVQNQDISDLEIILVNDYSQDNSLSIIEEIAKKEPRIKIINNKKNMGTLFSRTVGALSSKGKYIFHLDSDNMYLDSDVLSTVTNLADKENLDIVSFKGIDACRYNFLLNRISDTLWSNHTNNQVLHQPEMSLYPFRPGEALGNYIAIDSLIFLKCIKTTTYKKMLHKMGEERFSRKMLLEEDRAVIYGLFNTAESIKYIGKYGYLVIPTAGSSTSGRLPRTTNLLCRLYFLDISIEFTKDTVENSKLLAYIITFITDHHLFKELMELNEDNKKLFKHCLKKILDNKYISNQNKEEIRKRVSKFDFIND